MYLSGWMECVVLRPLTHEQKSIAQWIVAQFKARGDWPTFHEVDREFVKEIDGDVGEVVSAMLQTHGMDRQYLAHDRNRDVSLPPSLMLRCRGGEEAFEILMDAMPIILDVYLHTEDEPEIRHSDFLSRGWTEEKTARLGRFLRSVRIPFTRGGGSSPEEGTWHWSIDSSIKSYAQCRTAKEYLTWIVKEDRKNDRKWRKANRKTPHMLNDQQTPPVADRVVWWIVVPILVAVVAGLIIAQVT